MAPSVCQNTLLDCSKNQINSNMKTMAETTSNVSQNYANKENLRPPVYNPEDFALSLKKFGKKSVVNTNKSIYDTIKNEKSVEQEVYKSFTLPGKYTDFKSPMQLQESGTEMSLRQFTTVTDLLSKLRADLRASFPSFVQEFVSSPVDGVSLLLDVLRAIQLSQTVLPLGPNSTNSMPRNTQAYQRRALLDEMACLQCISICCYRSPEASARLVNTPVGLLPLAMSATGQSIRTRIIGLQLLTSACDKTSIGLTSKKYVLQGHSAVSDAISTMRLRCGEPVRFRLLIGMLNSGGGSGELQTYGLKFLNTFLESSENLQSRLYLQAELHQAGLEPAAMTSTISISSPWLDKLKSEIKRYEDLNIDIDKLQLQARDTERIRSQMVILERRVQILQEEKSVLLSMERRLQERCAELQRDVFRLQGARSNATESLKSDNKTPIALPRHVPPRSKNSSSEHEDEGISSSETGNSLSPLPIFIMPQENKIKKNNVILNNDMSNKDEDATIEDVIEELQNIVNDAEKEISQIHVYEKEREIVPVNLLPQPPKKSRALANIFGNGLGGSDLDTSDYGLLMMPQNVSSRRNSLCNDIIEYDTQSYVQNGGLNSRQNSIRIHSSTNREILDVIMNARHMENDPTMQALRDNEFSSLPAASIAGNAPAQHFSGVFFRSEMNTPQKYPRPDIAAVLEAKRVTKNIERIESLTVEEPSIAKGQSKNNQQIFFGSNPTLRINTGYNGPVSNITVTMGTHTTMTNNVAPTRSRSYTQGARVTELLSGMY
ncbi:mwh family protein [Megaselia abdita]